MDVIGGQDATLRVAFELDGQPVVPDVGSVMYTVRGNSGAAVSGLTDVPVTTQSDTTAVVITVAGLNNTLVKRTERRTVVIRFAVGGQLYYLTRRYRVVPWLNHAVEPWAVRSFVGVNRQELGDSEIDLVHAYLEVEAVVGQTTFDTALAAGGLTSDKANLAIKYRAVLDVLPSLQLKVAKAEDNGTMKFQRLDKIDFRSLHLEAAGRLGELLTELSGRDSGSFVLGILSAPVDPITGT